MCILTCKSVSLVEPNGTLNLHVLDILIENATYANKTGLHVTKLVFLFPDCLHQPCKQLFGWF